MKCPECENNQNFKDGTRYNKCRYQFIFNPKEDVVSDGKFTVLIRRASVNDTRHFTFNQLYLRYLRIQPRIGIISFLSHYSFLEWRCTSRSAAGFPFPAAFSLDWISPSSFMVIFLPSAEIREARTIRSKMEESGQTT